MDQMLEVLGLSDLEERVYLALLASAGGSLADISGKVGASAQRTRRALQSLEAKGLVSRRAGNKSRFVPTPPDVGIEVLVLRRQEELESIRLFASQLLDRFQSARQKKPIELVEIISGSEAVAQRFEQMQLLTKNEMLLCDRPPYASPPIQSEDDAGPIENPPEHEALRQGVTYRVIYDTAALEIPGRAVSVRRVLEAGEDGRAMSGLPMKLAIADRRLALLPLNMYSPGEETESALIQPSTLLDALVMLFELLWERALPLALEGNTLGRREDISHRDQDILALLAAGLSDQAIARQLGVGIRTVQRRMNVLMDRLNARTRFQAALLASKKGWIEE